jgi:methylglutaconyl-CoA hydratase
MSSLIEVRHEGPVAHLWINRPERHNAFDEGLIHDANILLDKVSSNSAVRVIVIGGRGESFCAGADLEWMRRAAALQGDANFHDARTLAALLYAVASCPKPVIARVHGSAYGGGVGLIAACDIAIGVPEAQFALTEVRLGLAAATMAPYVVGAIGARRARRLVLTGERFSAAQAREYGLLHEVVPAASLDSEIERLIELLLAGGPHAQAIVKDVMREIEGEPLSPALVQDTARRLAEVRISREGREGVAAFLEKRRPAWMKPE